MMPMMGGPPKRTSWKELTEQLEIQISNAEKNLTMMKAQLREAHRNMTQKTPEKNEGE